MAVLQDSGDTIEATSAETLFASRTWFERWLASFGGQASGWWRPPSPSRLELPYVIRTSHIGPFRVKVAWGATNFYTPKFDVCGPGTLTTEHLRAMMRDLEVSMLVFPLLSRTSKLARAFDQPHSGLWWFRDFCEAAPFVDCTGSWDDYLAGRGKSRCNRWLYYERRAAKTGMAVEMLSSWDDIARHFDEMLAVEAAGWKGKLGSSIAQNQALRRFYEGFCQDFAALNALRVFLLLNEKRIVAFQICALNAGVLTCLKIGYLEEYAKESPGQVLQLYIVRWAFSQPDVRIFDMLGPASPTKLKWATGIADLSTIYVFRQSCGGALARLRWKTGPLAKAWLQLQLAKVAPKADNQPAIDAESRHDPS